MRRARKLVGVLLVAGGFATVADAAITVAWQEPVGALQASAAQSDLRGQYARLTAQFAETSLVSARSTMLERAHTAGRLAASAHNGAPLGRLRIPRIGVSLVWLQGTDGDDLAKAPGHYAQTALPGRRGTVGIAGHRTTHGAPFRHIDRLDPGDRIEISMPYGGYEYAVVRTRIVSPQQAEVLRTAPSDQLVLTACHPVWSARQRIVVIARLVRWPNMLAGAPPLTTAPATPALRALRRARKALAGTPPMSPAPAGTPHLSAAPRSS